MYIIEQVISIKYLGSLVILSTYSRQSFKNNEVGTYKALNI